MMFGLSPQGNIDFGVFENKALRRIFGDKRDGVVEGWKRLHNEGLHDLYDSPSVIKGEQIKKDEMG
jgi:hypothetical protein